MRALRLFVVLVMVALACSSSADAAFPDAAAAPSEVVLRDLGEDRLLVGWWAELTGYAVWASDFGVVSVDGAVGGRAQRPVGRGTREQLLVRPGVRGLAVFGRSERHDGDRYGPLLRRVATMVADVLPDGTLMNARTIARRRHDELGDPVARLYENGTAAVAWDWRQRTWLRLRSPKGRWSARRAIGPRRFRPLAIAGDGGRPVLVGRVDDRLVAVAYARANALGGDGARLGELWSFPSRKGSTIVWTTPRGLFRARIDDRGRLRGRSRQLAAGRFTSVVQTSAGRLLAVQQRSIRGPADLVILAASGRVEARQVLAGADSGLESVHLHAAADGRIAASWSSVSQGSSTIRVAFGDSRNGIAHAQPVAVVSPALSHPEDSVLLPSGELAVATLERSPDGLGVTIRLRRFSTDGSMAGPYDVVHGTRP